MTKEHVVKSYSSNLKLSDILPSTTSLKLSVGDATLNVAS